jgi:hypothetical protein
MLALGLNFSSFFTELPSFNFKEKIKSGKSNIYAKQVENNKLISYSLQIMACNFIAISKVQFLFS